MALMSGHHIDFVAIDLAGGFLGRDPVDDPPAKRRDHGSGVRLVDAELAGDLQAREVQAHQVQAGDPDPQRQMTAGEDGAGQVVEAFATALALVPLAVGLGLVAAVLDDRAR